MRTARDRATESLYVPPPPPPAACSADHKAAIESEVVEVMQADAADEEYVDKMVDEPRSGGSWDYIVNCAGEMDHSKAESFHAKAVDIASKLATAAVALGTVKKFIQLSTATVYASNGKTPATESAKVEPWTTQAAFMLRAEEAVKAVPGLPYIILRPAVVYGPGDVNGIMPRYVTPPACSQRGVRRCTRSSVAAPPATPHPAFALQSCVCGCLLGDEG